MNILDKIVSLIAPHRCLGCNVEDNRLLCEGCFESMPLIPSRCYKCQAVTDRYAVCKACRSTTPLSQVAVFTYYQGLAKDLVRQTKYDRAYQGTEEIGRLIGKFTELFAEDSIFTHIPTASTRVRTRGYDHAKLICRSLPAKLSKQTLLCRVGQAHQVGAQRSVRLMQLKHAFRVLRPMSVRGKTVVLVDDVLTTGATLETAARELKRAGAKQVAAVVFAQAG